MKLKNVFTEKMGSAYLGSEPGVMGKSYPAKCKPPSIKEQQRMNG
jgi:hypothetical protein